MERLNIQGHVRSLVTLPVNDSPVISCYQALADGKLEDLNLFIQRMRSLRQSLGSQAKQEFDQGLARIQQYIAASLFAGAKGLAAFARGGESPFFLPLQFRVALPNWISVDTMPNIYHLVELKDSYHRYVVMIVTEESIRILQVNLGEVTAQLWEQCPDLQKRVGREWTKTHYQKHQRERKRRFYKDAIKVLDDLVSTGSYSHFLLAGHASVTSQVESELPKRLAEKLVDTVPVSGTMPLSDVIDVTLKSFVKAEEAKSQAVVADLLQQHRSGGLAVLGTPACVRAMQRGRADILVLAKEYQVENGCLCLHCDTIDLQSPPPNACRECGEHAFQQIDIKEQMARWAEEHGCRIEVVERSEELMEAGGVGCLLSYRLPDEYA